MGYVISGRMKVAMDDAEEAEFVQMTTWWFRPGMMPGSSATLRAS